MTASLPLRFNQTQPPLVLSGLRDLFTGPPDGGRDQYDGVICDVWGVLHDGVAPYPGTAGALSQLRLNAGPVILLSNAPRPSESIIRQLTGFGYHSGKGGHYDRLITSGDATRAAIASGFYGDTLLHIGPERDMPLLEGLDVECASLHNSRFALCTGLYDDERETPEDYRDLLRDLLARDLPMLCANPDNVVMRGGKMIFCAGAVARAYAAMGGAVTFFGKPYPGVYRLCLDALGDMHGRPARPGHVLAIGDGLSTDIAGGQAANMPTLLVSGGIHQEELALEGAGISLPALKEACAKAKTALPSAVIPRCIW